MRFLDWLIDPHENYVVFYTVTRNGLIRGSGYMNFSTKRSMMSSKHIGETLKEVELECKSFSDSYEVEHGYLLTINSIMRLND